MSFPPPPETWDPDDEYGRAQINEFMANMYTALQRERERVNEVVKNAGVIRPGPFVGHPGQPVLGTCADDVGVGGAGALADFITDASRATGELFDGPQRAAIFNTENQDDDGMFVSPDSEFNVQVAGSYALHGEMSFDSNTGPVPDTVTVALTLLVNGFNVGQTVQFVLAAQVQVVPVDASGLNLGPGDTITLAFGHDHSGDIIAAGKLVATRTTEVPPVEPQSYCIAVNFSGIPGHVQVPRDTFPLLAYTLLEHWGRWQDRGNGDLYLALFTDAHAGTPGNLDLEFTVPIPRGFTGWATNAMVLRYRLAFNGLDEGATTISVSLVVIDTRNGTETTPVLGTSSEDHDEAGGEIVVDYGRELTVTKDQLSELVGFREGTAVRLRFRVSLPGVHGSGVVGIGHLELNFE